MEKAWKKLVLKWLNCCGVGPIKTIQDVKGKDFLQALALSPVACPDGDEPFHHLLSYLQSNYSQFDENLNNPDDNSWTEDEELYMVLTLLLLHASIYQPSASFQEKAAQNLSESEQQLIVSFLQKAMKCDQNLTKMDLMNCLPSVEGSSSQLQQALISSPVQSKKQRRSQGTPLAEFLLSPVARQRRESGKLRGHLRSLENDLEREQTEKEELMSKISGLEVQVSEIGKRYKDKVHEAEALAEDLRVAQRWQAENVGDFNLEKRKLQQDLCASEKYVQQLENEISTLKIAQEMFQHKLLRSDERAADLEEILKTTKEELTIVKQQMLHDAEENVELNLRCSQLERDLNQIHSSALLSPGRPDVRNISPGSSPAPENLGFILEKEMIAKENKNVMLEATLKELKNELENLKDSYFQLEEKAARENESALRLQNRLQASLDNVQNRLDLSSQELSVLKREKEELISKLSDVLGENDILVSQVGELSAKKASLVTEQTALLEAQHSLEVKVAQLDARILIAAEREEELHGIIKKRATELNDMSQQMDEMDFKMSKALKERDLMEQQLNNTVKKLTVAKTMELEKANLEYQITSLKQTYDDLKKRSEATEMSKKDLNDKLNALTEEKRAADSHLRDVISKRDEIFASFHQVTAEKNTVIAENIALQKNMVHLDAQLTEAQRHIAEAKEELLKEEATKKALKNKVAELMASNDLLSSQLSISSQQENDVADQLTEVTKQKNVIENQLMLISKDKEKLNAALNECSSQLAKVSQERESQNILFTKQTTEYENALSRLNELATSVSCTESQLADERAESSRLKCHITDVTQKFDSALTELNQLKEEMERLHHNLEDKDTAITQLQAEKADIEDDLCHYVCKLNMATQENVSLKSEILSIRDERDTLISKYESLEQSKSSLEEKISLLNSDLLDACNQKDSLSTELELVSKHRDDLSYQLAEMRMAMSDLEKDLNLVTTRCSVSQEEVLSQSSQIKSLQQELDDMSKDFTSTKKALEDDCYEKSQQLSILRDDLFEVREKSESLVQERNKLLTDLHSEAIKNSALEEEVIRYKSQIENLLKEKQHVLRQLTETQLEKESALTSAKSLQQEIESIVLEKGDLLKTLQEMDEKLKLALLNNDQELKCALIQKEQEIKSEFSEKEEEYKSVLLTQEEKLKAALLDKEKSTNSLELLKIEMSENCEKFYAAEVKYKEMIKVLQDEVERVELDKKSLEAEIHNHSSTIIEASCKIQSLEKQIVENACTIQNLKEKLDVSHADFSRKLQEGIDEPQRLCMKQKELLEKAEKEKQALLSQIDELQSSIDVKDELLTNTRQYLEDLKGEKESLQELLKVKDEIITCQNATASSLERQSCDELDVAMKLLKEEMHSSHSTSSIIAQELKKVQKNFVEEKVKLQKALEEAQSSAKSYQQEAVELKQQLSAPRVGGKLSELQSDERMWQCDRIKNQVAFQFHSMMTQKIDLEEQLGQLRDILKDVSRMCDNLFATLPSSCNAVHEVTMMRQEVESKLRAVDRKYADSLCGIISLADEMFQWIKTQNRVATSTDSAENVSEYDEIDKKVSKSCEGMMSLGIDVRSAINSCKFLIERCESYLRAQTRESLKIKTSITKEEVGTINENCAPSEGGNSLTSIPMTVDLSSNLCTSTAPAEWFGGSASLEDGYKLIKSSYAELENQVCDLHTQLQKFQTPRTHQSTDAHGEQIADLQEQISLLKMRPTQEQLDEKLKELHTQYSSKLECMKVKMKQIVKDEVEKVEEEKLKSEKELIVKYTKRIAEFEEHIQQLSAQLWNLGEKLLKEQQDHKITRERFDALKERQRQYLMSKQRTQSLDRLDLTLQEKNYVTSSSLLSKRRCKSHVAQSGLASSKVHPECDTTIDVVDDSVSRRSTMMAPASMGLAFPEEDEDGEVFNNDYLTELKEGRCRVPSDRLPSDNSRLSVLQHRNSLCPPHLKSSYALETLDPQEVKDEDVKGPVQVVDARYKRQAKDRGTTSYQKPGPPTPSKKAGRLSLQGKEDLTPRVAALREHNDSQSSGIGMLRVGKTTPSRLRALFTSSKVASSTLPSSKKDESSTPATPTTKRLSIFRRRFGSNKENQSSNYSAFQ